ncbi:unnamed protein product, partial [Prorocentrum cordatum]
GSRFGSARARRTAARQPRGMSQRGDEVATMSTQNPQPNKKRIGSALCSTAKRAKAMMRRGSGRCRPGGAAGGDRKAHGEPAPDCLGSPRAEAGGPDSAGAAPQKLARGVRVEATAPTPPVSLLALFDAAAVRPAAQAPPAVVSLRRLLDARPAAGAAEGSARAEAVAEPPAAAAPAQLGGSAPPPPEPALPQVSLGHRDVLADAIRSMESRLARQGLLAAPASILGGGRTRKLRRGKRREQEEEEFYDPDDGFIDDADLEDLNACDAEDAAGATQGDADAPPDSQCSARGAGGVEAQLNVRGFRLTNGLAPSGAASCG